MITERALVHFNEHINYFVLVMLLLETVVALMLSSMDWIPITKIITPMPLAINI